MQVIKSACLALLLGTIPLGGCNSLPSTETEATLDDVTNGLQGNGGVSFQTFGSATFKDDDGDGLPDRRVADSVENPLSGAFYNDGGEGDVRAHTENFFTTGVGNSLTPAQAPKAQVKTAAIKTDRKMVYQGRMQVEVAQVDEAIERYTAKVNEWGGHLGSRENATITVRVPAAKFNEAVAELRGYGRVLSEAMQANDVTSQHLDLTIRLENAQKSRERLLALLQKAEKVEDMLKIEEQLHRLTEEIERMTGQLRFMNDQIAFSTLAVAFQGVSSAPAGKRGKPASMFQSINRIGVEPLRRAF